MSSEKFQGRLAYVVTGATLDEDEIGVPAMAFTDEAFADYMATKLGGNTYEVLLIETERSGLTDDEVLALAKTMTGAAPS